MNAALLFGVTAAVILAACGRQEPPAEALRPVRTAEIRYDVPMQTSRYTGSVQSRYEVDQGFRVGGKIARRNVDVGQRVREGDVLAVLDDTDYRLAVEAAEQSLLAAETAARQAESDRRRNQDLVGDGAVSASEDEQTRSRAQEARAAAVAEARKRDLARNRLRYTVLRASQNGVVTAVRAEVGQVVAEGQPVVAIADHGEPEIVVDVPERDFASFAKARYRAALASAPAETFDVALRELSQQASPQTRTYRARLKPVTPRKLPLGATAVLTVERIAGETPVAVIPASAITQAEGKPALWVVRPAEGGQAGTVELLPVKVHGYRNEEVLVSGLPPGERVVTAGVQKMAPGLKVAIPEAAAGVESKQAAR